MNFSYTAQEAYDASLLNFEEEVEKNKQELDDMIKAAVERGEFSIVYDKLATLNTYTNMTKTLLNQLGYKVTEKVVSEERKIWIISWEKPGVITDPEEDPAP